MNPLLIGALAAPSIIGAFQGSKTTGEGFEAIPSTGSQDKARDYLKDLALTPVKHPTQQIAGMAEGEVKAQDLLSRFLSEGPSEERGTALSFLTGVLGMPMSNMFQLPEIQALFSTIKDWTSDLVNMSLHRTQKEGMGTSGPQGSAVGRELAKGQTSMVAALAPYMSQARSNQLTASQIINSLVAGEDASAIGKIGAGMTYGALPRQLSQAEMDAEYQKRVNDILAKYNLNAPVAGDVLGEKRMMYNPGTVSPNPLSLIGSAMPGLAMMYGALSTPATVGAATGAGGQAFSPTNPYGLTPGNIPGVASPNNPYGL